MARLYVIAGHGGGDPGAGGHGYEEHERVVALGKEIVARGGGQVDHYPWDKNAYADRAMDWLDPGCPIVELHMDSAGGSARGGHVIIASGLSADSADNALAALMRDVFPGRSQLIVGRDNLRNANVAKRRGINYRLVENGFIDNATDIAIFNSNIGKLANGYLRAFGIIGESANPQQAGNPMNNNGFYYRAHVADYGWLDAVHDGQVAGTTGKGKQLEAIKMRPIVGLELTVKAHIQDIGWKSYKVKPGNGSGTASSDIDPIIGTVGKGKRIEALEVVVDKNTTGKKLRYQVHVAEHGWTGWIDAGYAAGSVGLGLAIEAVQFVLE